MTTHNEEIAAWACAASDAHLVHQLRNSRALLRRRNLSLKMRESLPTLISCLEAECARRGVLARGWRQFPDRSGGPLLFGTAVGDDGEIAQTGPLK